MFARAMSEHIIAFEKHLHAVRAKHYIFWLIDFDSRENKERGT
jgi:hypothetical protein